MVNIEKLREHLHYDKETGVLSWKKIPSNLIKLGPTGFMRPDGYLAIGFDYKVYTAHRLAWMLVTGKQPERHIDHINGIRHDNRWANLRECSRTENGQNLKRAYSNNKSSGLLGAYHHNSGRWCSRIQINGKAKSLGLFDTKEEAHAAYIKAKRELHPFGCL